MVKRSLPVVKGSGRHVTLATDKTVPRYYNSRGNEAVGGGGCEYIGGLKSRDVITKVGHTLGCLMPVSRSGRAGQSRKAGCVFYLVIFIYCFLNFLTFVNKIFVGHTVLNISIPIRRSLYMGLLVPFRPL